MYKILTLVGTRPELIKMSVLIPKLENYFNHILVHTGQNYDYNLNKIFFKELKIKKPDFFLNVKDKNLSKMISNIIYKTDVILEKTKPDAILIYGDTNSCLGIISAKRRKIPIFHLEAGNRCFDQRVPEEINRKVVDHLSDVNMVISSHAKQNLLDEGIKKDFIFHVGSNMQEVIEKFKKNIEKSKILEKLRLRSQEYILVSLHREENVDEKQKLRKILISLNKIKKENNIRIIISTHPRTKNNMCKFKMNYKNLEFLKPFGFYDYCNLQKNSFCTISDSGTIFEESSILNFPAITVRDSHERHEGIDGGSVLIHSDMNINLLESIKISRKLRNNAQFTVNDYNQNFVSEKIINIIQSYIPYVNDKIWKKKL
jgi:UDP-N-acetylglucosamine 2-epimerase (non-hydrolysing)